MSVLGKILRESDRKISIPYFANIEGFAIDNKDKEPIRLSYLGDLNFWFYSRRNLVYTTEDVAYIYSRGSIDISYKEEPSKYVYVKGIDIVIYTSWKIVTKDDSIKKMFRRAYNMYFPDEEEITYNQLCDIYDSVSRNGDTEIEEKLRSSINKYIKIINGAGEY